MAATNFGLRSTGRIGDSGLSERLSRAIRGEVLFDAFSRGRYATDASHYQLEPIGVTVPRDADDVQAVLAIAASEGLPVLPRGAGTSQCGQSVAEAIVMDMSRHMNRVLALDVEAATATVQPGLVLDHLNAALKPHDLWFPVDVSTAAQATIGGMTGNNSCGSRSIRYGTMRDNVAALNGMLTDGSRMHFGPLADNAAMSSFDGRQLALVTALLELGRRSGDLVNRQFPDLMRRVGGYNLDALMAGGPRRGAWSEAIVHSGEAHPNLAHLLVGSEGTLAVTTSVDLKLQPIPRNKTLGVCHFPRFYDAMDAAQHLTRLGPVAVELVDRTMIGLARDIPLFRDTVEQFVRGDPDALLLVEFAEEDNEENLRRLRQLGELMGDLGFPGAVVEATEPAFQSAIWEVRKSGLNIMMSMKGDGKPLSFIEDCAVRLEDLAEYTSRLTEVFHAHGTEGTWYAHASVGCLHVRPVLNLKEALGATQLRDIAEQAFEMVREYKGSHSGEHGDGLVRSEFHEAMFGPAMVGAFKEVKTAFDPGALLNPGKIVDPPKMDDRTLFRFKPGYQTPRLDEGFDWRAWGGFAGAAEMCNNNGACRKAGAGVMCPSFRATGEEKHLTRGRANTLRLALSGQLGPDALVSESMKETMSLCVGCKGCRRECPTGVDMAKMKIEFLHQYRKRHGTSIRERLVAHLPRYAPWAARHRWLMHARDSVPGAAWLSEKLLGFAARRSLPRWSDEAFNDAPAPTIDAVVDPGRTVVLLADTFNRYFEPNNLRDAVKTLRHAGLTVLAATLPGDERPLCCGRTYLSAGMLEEARHELTRCVKVLAPFARAGVPIVGLEPSCLLTFRDELTSLLHDEDAAAVSEQVFLFEELLTARLDEGSAALALNALPEKRALLHGHCHQKAFNAMGPVESLLRRVPGLDVQSVNSSCCGMAGSFGYESKHYDMSLRMAELDLLPAVRAASQETLIVADGTSCRHQIHDGTMRQAQHVASVLARALPKTPETP